MTFSSHRNTLESACAFNKLFKLHNFNEDHIAIPICLEQFKVVRNTSHIKDKVIQETVMKVPFSKHYKIGSTYTFKLLKNEIEALLFKKTENHSDLDQILQNIPSKWQRHGDLILFPQGSFSLKVLRELEPDLWQVCCNVLKAKRIARIGYIHNNGFRTPNCELLYGIDGWVSHNDNGIIYTFDVTKCMFSFGNITEKLRVGNFDCSGETVMDLYTGIGYFVLPYLIHAKAKFVYACEWNPHAVEALKRNLKLNNVSDRCLVIEGDNREVRILISFNFS